MAMASTGRSATPISRRGTTASRGSPASPARTRGSNSSPTGSSSRPWRSTASSLRSSRRWKRITPRAAHFPTGLANRSDALGRYLMDHVMGLGATGTHPGFLDRYYYGRRPAGFYLPRYVNLDGRGAADFARGFGFQGYSYRSSWGR